MPETIATEELSDETAVEQYLDIHLQDTRKVVITKVTGEAFNYTAEGTFPDDGPVPVPNAAAITAAKTAVKTAIGAGAGQVDVELDANGKYNVTSA